MAKVHARWAMLRGAVGLMLVLCLLPATTHGQTQDQHRAVEAGREALDGRTHFPWYDAEADSIQRIDVEASKDAAAHRNSTWKARQPRPRQVRPRWSGWGLVWSVVQALIWIVLIGLFALLLYLLIRAFINAEPEPGATTPDEVRSVEDLIESLPFDVARPQTDLLGEARRHYEQGAFGEAIIYLYSYQLVKLDQHGFIRLTRGKTNRQYLSEIFSRPALHAMLERTMVAFEDVFFGRHQLGRQRFESCWLGLDEFHRRLEEVWG